MPSTLTSAQPQAYIIQTFNKAQFMTRDFKGEKVFDSEMDSRKGRDGSLIVDHLYSPVVPNWQSQRLFQASGWKSYKEARDKDLLVDPDQPFDALVFDTAKASVQFSVKATLTNHNRLQLELDVNAVFRPAGGNGDPFKSAKTFVPHYQDEIGLTVIAPKKEGETLVLGLDNTKEKHFYALSATGGNSIAEHRITDRTNTSRWNGGLTIALDKIVAGTTNSFALPFSMPLSAGIDRLPQDIATDMKDFSSTSRSSNHDHRMLYNAKQLFCRSGITTAPYDCEWPHESMRFFRGLPDSFREPAAAASSGLIIASKQTYNLGKLREGRTEVQFTCLGYQRQVTHSMWLWTSGYQIVNHATVESNFTVQLENAGANIVKHEFFKQTVDVADGKRELPNPKNLGPISEMEHRLFLTWDKGIAQKGIERAKPVAVEKSTDSMESINQASAPRR